MVGELSREGGLLILIFGVLDALIDHESYPWWWYAIAVGVSLGLMVFGAVLERKRRE